MSIEYSGANHGEDLSSETSQYTYANNSGIIDEPDEADDDDDDDDAEYATPPAPRTSSQAKRTRNGSSSRKRSKLNSAVQSDPESETIEATRDDDELEDDLDDDDDDEPAEYSTDMSRLTERQRARLMDDSTDLEALPNEGTKKKIYTEEELMLRRTETARRRKNLSEKRREEEKMDTINRLLKKQAPKRKGKVKSTVGSPGTPAVEDGVQFNLPKASSHAPSPDMYRWVSNINGNRLGIPTNMK
ncbi:PAPA-1-like conserved region-domain-containing protein [Myxozyma melibiosi]|uniref:PAPA-1-like conserved region-domain-containing protein n=1 Tax=Myxozyma melibiosi TaxID=54550 RepID=A0ABR1EXQ4_9ASCO